MGFFMGKGRFLAISWFYCRADMLIQFAIADVLQVVLKRE